MVIAVTQGSMREKSDAHIEGGGHQRLLGGGEKELPGILEQGTACAKTVTVITEKV